VDVAVWGVVCDSAEFNLQTGKPQKKAFLANDRKSVIITSMVLFAQQGGDSPALHRNSVCCRSADMGANVGEDGVEHLVLLVGSNPLPNYLTALALQPGKVTLVYFGADREAEGAVESIFGTC